MSPLFPHREKNHRFPAEMIRHGVWRSCRCCLSSRDVEALLLARGMIVTSEAIRKGCRQFGPADAHQRRRRRPSPGDKGPLNEVLVRIHGTRHDLWRAVD